MRFLHSRLPVFPRKFLILFVLFVILLAVFFSIYLTWLNRVPQEKPIFGVTFSTVYADQLNIDKQEAYQAIVEDLGVRNVRLPVYWSEVENQKGDYDWSSIDWLMNYSEDNDVNIIMAIGSKVPRWPECFIPDWVEKMSDVYRQAESMNFIKKVVLRYKDSPALTRWQIENEPFFPFGECPTTNVQAFFEEVEFVRGLDDHPIQVTVSGEMEPWNRAGSVADVLGVSMYRITWNDLFGYWFFPITPEFYRVRAKLVSPYVEKVIISELQAEPWFPEPIENRSLDEWYTAFDAEIFEKNIDFAERTGLSEVYLWGAEWWYLLRENGDSRLWDVGREVFSQ